MIRKKKIETTALWIDCGITFIKTMENACHMVTVEVVTKYPLLWNTSFVSDTNFHKLREEYRYKMAK